MSAEVDLDPQALRGVADELAAVAVAVQTLSSHVAPGAGAATHFGEPDAQRRLAGELAAKCDDVIATLSHAGRLSSALAEELLACAQRVAAADERSAHDLRAAEG
ncbi:MAG: hypothetical protein ACRDTE_10210 [Pseudonocardiaceae bacterium]